MILRRLVLLPALLIALLAIAGPSLAPQSPTRAAGRPFAAAGGGFLLGTDVLGRDVLSRVLHGGQTLLVQAVAATLIGSAIGLGIGLWSTLTRHRRFATAALRLVDGIAALPGILLLLLLAAGAPGDDIVVTVAIVVVSIPFSVRVLRERAAALAATDYAQEALARGDSFWQRARHDILPGLLPTALSEAGIRFVAATQLAATAGFLGLGAGAPAANWGRMVRENSVGLATNPLPVLIPAALLVLLALSVTFFLDRLGAARDRLGAAHPRLTTAGGSA